MRDLTFVDWKLIEKFASAQVEAARDPMGRGQSKIETTSTSVTLEIPASWGEISEDREVAGRMSWKAFALLLADKVNHDTLAAVVRDYNEGKRPAKAGFFTHIVLDGLDVGTARRAGAIRVEPKAHEHVRVASKIKQVS